MSKLDDIFHIEAGETWTAEKAKQQIKDLMLEIYDNDIDIFKGNVADL